MISFNKTSVIPAIREGEHALTPEQGSWLAATRLSQFTNQMLLVTPRRDVPISIPSSSGKEPHFPTSLPILGTVKFSNAFPNLEDV